jgi:hypothetical protein
MDLGFRNTHNQHNDGTAGESDKTYHRSRITTAAVLYTRT